MFYGNYCRKLNAFKDLSVHNGFSLDLMNYPKTTGKSSSFIKIFIFPQLDWSCHQLKILLLVVNSTDP